MTRTKWFVLGFVAGAFFGMWRALRVPIDEYHATRMDLEDELEEIRRLLEERSER